MTDRITARINQDTSDNASQDSRTLTTPRRIVTWRDDAGPVNITGSAPVAYAGRADRQVQLEATVLDAAAGEVLVTWDADTLTAGQWTIEHRLTLGSVISSVAWMETVIESFFAPPTGEPIVTALGTITLTGTGPVTATFAAPPYTGTEPINVSLAATRDGGNLSVTGSDGNGTASIAKTGAAQTVSAVWTLDGPVGDPVVTDAVTVTVPAYTVPAAALAPTLTPTGATSLTATLAADEADGGSAITDRTLVYTVNAGAEVSVTGLAAEATHSITGLTAGDTVVARIDVTTAAGTTEGATATAETWLLPEAPVAGTLVGAVGEVVYTWPATPELNGRSLVREDYILYDDTDTQIGTGQRVGGEATTTITATAGAGRYIRSNAVTDAGAGPLSPASNAVTVLTGATASLTEFARQNTVWPSGTETAANSATIDFAGTTNADDGTNIRVRLVRDDTGAEVHGWQVMGQASSGAWSGSFTGVTRSAFWLRAEVDVQGSAAPAGDGTSRFKAGHVVAITGQSELWRFISTSFANTANAPTVSDPDALQIYGVDGDYVTTLGGKVTTATPVSSHAATLSNLLSAAYPGETFAICLHAEGGTPRAAMYNDGPTAGAARTWAREQALRDFAFPETGMRPRLAAESWFFNDMFEVTGTAFANRLRGAVEGLDAAGGALQPFDHVLTEMYPDLTHHVVMMHRYDGTEGIKNNLGPTKIAVRNMIAGQSGGTVTLLDAPEPVVYLNNATDIAHPTTGGSVSYLNGMVRLWRGIMHGIMAATGRHTTPIPEFDSAVLAADRSKITVTSSAGNITTLREIDGTPTRPAGYAQVTGFWHNGARCTVANIVGGAVEVFPEGAATFVDGDTFSFAPNGYGVEGDVDALDGGTDAAEVFRDIPLVVYAGQSPLIEGVPVQSAPDAAVINPIPEAAAPVGYDPALSIAPDGSSFREGIVNTFQAGGGWTNDSGAAGTFWPDGTSSDETIQFDCSDNGKVRAVLNSDAWTTSPIGVATTLKFYVTGSGAGTLGVEAVAAGNGGGVDVWGTASVDLSTDKGTLITISGTPDAARARIEVNFQMSVLGSGTLTIHTPVMEAS